jgi:hypothetical protein
MRVRRTVHNEKSYAEVGYDFVPIICVNNACQLSSRCESSARPAASRPFADNDSDWAAGSTLYAGSPNQNYRSFAAISFPNRFQYRSAHTSLFTNSLARAPGIRSINTNFYGNSLVDNYRNCSTDAIVYVDRPADINIYRNPAAHKDAYRPMSGPDPGTFVGRSGHIANG